MRPLVNWRTFETPDYIELQRGESILAIEKCTRKFGCTVPLVPLLAVATVPFGLATAGLALFVGLAIAILIWASWRKIVYVITSRRIIERSGLLMSRLREIPLADIRNVTVTKSSRESLIKVETASGKPHDLELVVDHPDTVLSLLNRFSIGSEA